VVRAYLRPCLRGAPASRGCPSTLSCASRELYGHDGTAASMLASARMLHALVAEKLRRGNGGTGAACGDDGELLDALMARALRRRGARARRGALCRGRSHVSKRQPRVRAKVERTLVERGEEDRR